MFDDAYTKCGKDECAAILEEINPLLRGGSFDPATVTILAQDLSFYPGYRFLDIADHDIMPPLRKIAIYKPGDAVILDWTNGPVYTLNKRIPVRITETTVVDYVRFFFSCVRGPYGRPAIVENVDDVEWSDEPPPAARKAVGQVLDSVSIEEKRDDGSFRLKICMTFQSGLYRTALIISPLGQIESTEEEILIDDMPILDSALGQ